MISESEILKDRDLDRLIKESEELKLILGSIVAKIRRENELV